MSCQPHRVTSGQSNSAHKQIRISKLFSHICEPSVKSIYEVAGRSGGEKVKCTSLVSGGERVKRASLVSGGERVKRASLVITAHKRFRLQSVSAYNKQGNTNNVGSCFRVRNDVVQV